jgi:DNA-binding NarL/FixJ family response regulator
VVVAEATNGEEAIECARLENPDVIVMDINMPVMNGVEATRRIKTEMPKTRVVALSVHEEDAMIQAMQQAGASAYEKKGVNPDALFETIRHVASANQGKNGDKV